MFRSLALTVGLLCGLVLGYTPDVHNTSSYSPTSSAKLGVRSVTADPKLDLGWLQAAKESTVIVRTPTGHGSGVCVGWVGDRDLILTAKHVVDDLLPGQEITLHWASGDTDFIRSAELVRLSETYDLALISAYDPQHLLKPRYLAKDELIEGEEVIAIGFPLDIYPPMVSLGHVTGVEWYNNVMYSTHNAPIWYGNSGGPLFNKHGRLVGINVWMNGYNGHAASDRAGSVMLLQITEFLEL